MLYIITEDTNSARTFWKIVADIWKTSDNYTLVPLLNDNDGKQVGGNTALENQVNDLLPKLNRGDELFIVFDYINNTRNFIPGDFILLTYQKCRIAGVNFKFTSYYCFEEIYLSYTELYRMICSNGTKTTIIRALRFVQECINHGKNYFDKTQQEVIDFINFYQKDAGSNREHFANALLISVTQLLDGKFKIIKSGNCFYHQGACWVLHCDDVRKLMRNEYEINNVCKNKCRFTCKDCSSKEKLFDLNNHSILEKSIYDITEI